MWCRNREGYADYTAGLAVSRASREERKVGKGMGKKRSCRRTSDENRIHEKAVKVRKMTDEQLIEYIENRVSKAKSEGFNEGKKKGYDLGFLKANKETTETQKPISKVWEFLEDISVNKIQGIGKTTADKLKIYAKEGGFFE